MKKETISSRGLVLVTEDGSCYPIFIGDPHTIINTSLNKTTKEFNRKLQEAMKAELDAYIVKLSFFSRRKAKKYVKGYKKYNFFDFIKDEGVTAFNPGIPLLDFVLQFCIKFNCLEVLHKCLEIVDYQIFTETPNCKVNSDVLYGIMCSKNKSKLHFVWVAGETDWSVDLKKR